MDDFWTWPAVFQGAVFGAIGGLAGGLIGGLLRRRTGKAKDTSASTVITVICVCIAIFVGNGVAAPHRQAADVDAAINVLKTHSVYAALFKYHPDSETALRAKLTDIVRTAPPGQVQGQVSAAISQTLDRYFSRDILYAPDSAVRLLLDDNLATQTKLQAHPEDCVTYFLGKPPRDQSLFTAQDVTRESDAKAAVIAGAATHPSPPAAHPDLMPLAVQIAKGFQTRGYDVNDLRLLSQLTRIPPADGCRVAVEYITVLDAMPDAQASAILKAFDEAAGN
jgi:hypothetical protein